MARIKITGNGRGPYGSGNLTVEVDGEIRKDVAALSLVADANTGQPVTIVLTLLVESLEIDVDAEVKEIGPG